jgi:hypothetical protein
MNAPVRRHFRRALFAKFCVAKSCVSKAFVVKAVVFACAALSCSLLSLPFIASSAAAQDYGHMRVEFSYGAAWTESYTSPRLNSTASLPPGSPHAGYGYAHNAESGAPQDRVRLKASSFSGM